jgi:hypothetical protein
MDHRALRGLAEQDELTEIVDAKLGIIPHLASTPEHPANPPWRAPAHERLLEQES